MLTLREAMSKGAALIRTEQWLGETIETIIDLKQSPLMTSGLKSALASAELIAQGALMREESRGGAHRSDFPARRMKSALPHGSYRVDASEIDMVAV